MRGEQHDVDRAGRGAAGPPRPGPGRRREHDGGAPRASARGRAWPPPRARRPPSALRAPPGRRTRKRHGLVRWWFGAQRASSNSSSSARAVDGLRRRTPCACGGCGSRPRVHHSADRVTHRTGIPWSRTPRRHRRRRAHCASSASVRTQARRRCGDTLSAHRDDPRDRDRGAGRRGPNEVGAGELGVALAREPATTMPQRSPARPCRDQALRRAGQIEGGELGVTSRCRSSPSQRRSSREALRLAAPGGSLTVITAA